MTTRNKILLSVGAVCLVAVIAVVAVVAVFAARTQQVSSSITVKYTASEVEGSVSANYYVGNGTAVKMYKNGTEASGTSLPFLAGKEKVEDSLAPANNGAISLDALEEDKLYIVFEYIFTNTGAKDYTAKLTFTGTLPESVDVYAYNDTVEPGSWTAAEQTDKKVEMKPSSTDIFTSETVGKKAGDDATTKKLYVVFHIPAEKSNTDINFTGSFDWTLTGVKGA